MEFSVIYDMNKPGAWSLQLLLMKLYSESEMEVDLPWGDVTMGVITEVEHLGGPLVNLTIMIDDVYETQFYVNHIPGDMSLVRRNSPACLDDN
jgi:hypothetical protein